VIRKFGGSFRGLKESVLSTLTIDWTTLALKLVLVPTFIGVVSLAGRRWGTTISGWLVGLPLTSGPVAFFLALEQGKFFAYEASEAIMVGIVSSFAFCVVYSRLAISHGWPKCTLAGMTAFFVSTFLLDLATMPLFVAFAFSLLVLVLCALLMPHVGSDKMSPWRTKWELPGRMVSATALVILITGFAPFLGPQLTGLLSPFPIYATTLGVFTHRSQGGEEAVKLLRGVVVGSFTFIVFFLILSLTIVAWGIAPSFLMAICASLLTHGTSLKVLKFRNRTTSDCNE
jgi:hypothetical protein